MQKTQRMWVQTLGQKDPLEEGMATHSSILAGESHGQRSLEGYTPTDHKESDMTEQLSTQSDLIMDKNRFGSSGMRKYLSFTPYKYPFLEGPLDSMEMKPVLKEINPECLLEGC